MLPATPQLKFSHPTGPSSPPETPRTASPVFNRQSSSKYPGRLSRNKAGSRPMAQQQNAGAASGGPAFNFGLPIRGDQLSPQSTSSSESSTESDTSDAESITSEHPEASPPSPRVTPITRISHYATFTVEEIGNFDPNDEERHGALRPDHFEYPESDRSRSRSRNPHPPDLEPTFMHSFRNLDCVSDSDSDETDFDEDDYQRFLVKRRLERKHKRMSSGSIGKRSITESIGSDTDMEDLKVQYLDAALAGAQVGVPSGSGSGGVPPRRVKRKLLGNRQSLQFTDPPLPRIDQADEPDTSDGEFLDDDALKEMPYYTLEQITMEIDSPSP